MAERHQQKHNTCNRCRRHDTQSLSLLNLRSQKHPTRAISRFHCCSWLPGRDKRGRYRHLRQSRALYRWLTRTLRPLNRLPLPLGCNVSFELRSWRPMIAEGWTCIFSVENWSFTVKVTLLNNQYSRIFKRDLYFTSS